mgnify:CR=1 FL=1
MASGGHSHLVVVKDYGEYEIIGRTRDDAAGEAFDKVARAIGLGYPGGPKIDKVSKEGNPDAIHFPRAAVAENEYDFSFSGLKSAVLNYLNGCQMKGEEINQADVAASFQKAVVDVLVSHSLHAVKAYGLNKFAIAGGVAGVTVQQAMRYGVARGLFSNESGLGSAPIVAAAAKTKWPAEQGLVSMTGTFIDTIIICTMTGLSIIVSGAWNGDLNGAALTEAAFASAFPAVAKYVLTGGLVLFAFTTIIGWSYYGERCAEYLFGVKCIMPYRIGYIILVGLGVFLKLEMIWIIADIVNGLMAIPNLIALLGLSGVVVAETKLYFEHWEKVHSRRKQLAEIREDLATENN